MHAFSYAFIYTFICAAVLAACGQVKSNVIVDGAAAGDGDGACVPESDAAFCLRTGKTCESQTAPDNCGLSRTTDCGTCAGGDGCVVGVCQAPVCTSFSYTSTPLAAFDHPSLEEVMAAATPDGQTLMYLHSPTGCGSFVAMIADETAPGSGIYTSYDATATLAALGLDIVAESFAFASDGRTLIARTSDAKTLVSVTRSGPGHTDFGTLSTADFAAINATIAGNAGTLRAPVLSADGLELLYTINNVGVGTDGTYSAVRDSTAHPFPAGRLLPSPVADDEFAVGISSDRLTLFMFNAFTSAVLTRTSTNGLWVNPNAPAAAPAIGGWEHKPLADCAHLVGMSSQGGCQNEDIFVFTRQ
ncbi:MAG: hypothetical protein ABI467_15435 [Kofleriaceae bacterium]